MCFWVNRKNPEPFKAEKDIFVFKSGVATMREFKPTFQSAFTYKAGRFNPYVGLKVIPYSYSVENAGYINEGYHAYVVHDRHHVDALMMIPAGTEYYYNAKDDQVVASQMVYVGKLNWFREWCLKMGRYGQKTEHGYI